MRTEGAQRFAADVDAGAGAVTRLDRQTQRAGDRMTTAGRRLDRLGRQSERLGRTMSRKVTAPLALAGGAAVKLAVDFDKGMRNVNSLAQLPEKALKNLSNQVLALAGPTAQAPETLAAGLYDLISTGYSTRDAMKVLKTGAFAATAGLTDTATATSSIVSGMQAFHLGADQASRVSDIWFKTVDIGRISFEQLSSELGQVLAPASAMGVSMESLGAGMATLTKGGYSAGDAAVGLRNIFTQLLKPSPKLNKQLEKMGVKSGPEAIKKFGGLQGVLVQLRKQVHGSVPEFGKLFNSQQATSAAFALTGENAKTAAKDFEGVKNSTGATALALQQQSKSTAYRWQKMIAQLKTDAIKVGDIVLPTLDKMIGGVSKLVDEFKKLPDPVQKAAGGIAIGLAALGPLLVAGGALAKGAGWATKLFGRGKGGGLGKAAGKAGVVPVFVTNWGGGPGGGTPGGGKSSKVKTALKWAKRGGPLALESAAAGSAATGLGALGLGAAALATYKTAQTIRRGENRAGVSHSTKGMWINAQGFPAKGPGPGNRFLPRGTALGGGGAHGLSGVNSYVAKNTAAMSGYRGIPTAASVKSDERAAERAAAKVIAANKAPFGGLAPIVIQIDGHEVARATQRAAKKDKARR